MKIIDKRSAHTVDFRTIEAGQPFYYPMKNTTPFGWLRKPSAEKTPLTLRLVSWL